MAVQSQFDRYYQQGYPGDLARPSEPHAFDLGVAHVPANGRKPRPGDAVYYNAAENAFAVPVDAATQRQAVGVVSYDPGLIQGTLAAPPADSNSDRFVEFEDGDPLKILVLGTAWVIAGSAMEYGQLVQQASFGGGADYQWDVWTPDVTIDALTQVAQLRAQVIQLAESLHRRVFECVSPAPVAANGSAQVRIGYGRIV